MEQTEVKFLHSIQFNSIRINTIQFCFFQMFAVVVQILLFLAAFVRVFVKF